MLDYDFHTLSPIEFEALCRDLLQKELSITLESFSVGADGGIDFRYNSPSKDNPLIVQCKHYATSFSKLKSHLKKEELKKVKKLLPTRYILTTSLPLNPKQKEELKALLSPYVSQASDIYGRQDLNNLLSKFKDIEKQHYKLWLSSTSVLEQILHTDIVNRTAFEQEDMLHVVSLYVENESYQNALDIFSKNRFVIISGNPGVGKTTLARMMTYRLLADGQFEEFVYISRGVEEAIKLYDAQKKQLFFFDDFLGRNYFEKGFDRNEDKDLITFIERVSNSKNKGLILTTREYILKQAQQQYALLDAKLIRSSKYVIELEKYTKTIRAKILYNHLFSFGVPQAHLDAFLDARTYEYLINHDNYSPRLIETILKEKPWEDAAPEQFPKIFTEYFDEPNKLWQDAYTNGVSERARKLLKVLFTLKTPVLIPHLFNAFNASNADLSDRPDYHVFENTVKELEDTFINLRKEISFGRNTPSGTGHSDLIVDYKNPSILDFLFEYFAADSRRNDLLSAIKYPAYIDQLTLRFIDDKSSDEVSGQLAMTPEIRDSISKSILVGFDKLPFSEEDYISRHTFSTKSYRIKTYPQVLRKLIKEMKFIDDPSIAEHLFKNYLEFNESDQPGDFDSQFYLLELFESKMSDEQVQSALYSLEQSIASMEDYEWFMTNNPNNRSDSLIENWREDNKDRLNEQAKVIAIETINELDLEELSGYEDTIDYYEDYLGLDITEIKEAYEEAVYEAGKVDVIDYDSYDPDPGPMPVTDNFVSEDAAIRDMFNSLRQE